MPALAALIGILILAAIYLVASAAVVVFVSTPLTMAGLAAGVFVGLVVGLQRTSSVLSGRARGTPVRTAVDVAAGRIAGRVRAESVRRDYAWPQYFAVQIRLDLLAVMRVSAAAVRRAWVWTSRPLAREDSRRVILFFWPLLLPVLAILIGLSIGAAAMAVVAVIVLAAAAAMTWTVGPLTVGLLRAADRSWQWARRASGSCPRCFHVTSLPAYRCPGSHAADDRRRGLDLHRDIRPGRLGVLWRRCGCGQRLPTTVLRAAWRLEARCPVCTEPLHEGAAIATDVRIPVFGAASAGKTHLIMAGLGALLGTCARRGISAGFLDDHSRAAYAEFRELAEGERSVPKTSTATPVAVTVSLRNGVRAALVHFFDAAGEVLVDAAQNSELAYLDYARTLIFVLDPFSIPDVLDQTAAGYPDTLRAANAATYDAEQSYNATVTRLHLYGVDTRRQRLAFVVSKADLLERLPIAAGLASDSQSVRSWLAKMGLDNLVTSATRDFAVVEYFLVSATDLSSDGAFAPFRWLLASERVSV